MLLEQKELYRQLENAIATGKFKLVEIEDILEKLKKKDTIAVQFVKDRQEVASKLSQDSVLCDYVYVKENTGELMGVYYENDEAYTSRMTIAVNDTKSKFIVLKVK